MIEFQFNNYNFKVDEKSGRLRLNGFPLSEIQLAGGARPSLSHNLCIGASESASLRYVSHEIKGARLCVVEQNERIEVVTLFISYGETNRVAVEKTIKNISGVAVKIETAATLVLGGKIRACEKGRGIQQKACENQENRVTVFSARVYRFFERCGGVRLESKRKRQRNIISCRMGASGQSYGENTRWRGESCVPEKFVDGFFIRR